jgi:hypothetical protein
VAGAGPGKPVVGFQKQELLAITCIEFQMPLSLKPFTNKREQLLFLYFSLPRWERVGVGASDIHDCAPFVEREPPPS